MNLMKYIKPVLDFWKRDIINKLIVVVVLGLIGAAFAFVWLIFNMPQGNSLTGAFSNFLPTQPLPTFDINTYLTPNADAPALSTATEAAVFLPTFTPFVPPSPIPTVEPPTATVEVPTALPESLPTPTAESAAQPQPLPGEFACIPSHPPQTGKVVEVLDGNTARILVDKLIYVVRYIGVDAPKDKILSDTAKAENSKLIYGKEVLLIVDASDKDARGRLLRYVVQGNIFINQKMIEQGLGSALNTPPDSACAEVFKQAEQTASAALIGIWSPTATPKTP